MPASPPKSPSPPTPSPSPSTPSTLGLIASPADLARYQEKFGAANVTVEQPTEFQTAVLLRTEKEIALLGGKFGGKSWVARTFLLKGNPYLPDWDSATGAPILVNQSYIYNPNYRGLILRRNQVDLTDFIKKFEILCKPYGGRYVNGRFEFPSGAFIDAGHLADREAWQKYIGNEYTRIVIEEGALIPELFLYEQMVTCCRTTDTSMSPQLLITSNAGGPGTGWLIERFYEAKDSEGKLIPPGQTIYATVPNPYNPEEMVTTTRIFMFSTMKDNPYAKNDPSYLASMANITDEKMRAAYIHGEWRVFVGEYFTNFRPRGPHPGEPPEASHVIPANLAPPLPSWTPIIGSLDVGMAHESAAYWARLLPTRQHHIYRELVVSNFSSYIQLGYEIARLSVNDLNLLPSHSIVFWISHDAFHSRLGKESKSIVELLALGVARVLGENGVHLPDLVIQKLKEQHEALSTSTYRQYDAEEELTRAIKQINSQSLSGITFRRAPSDRVIGWQYCREGLRWERIGQEIPPFSPQIANILLQTSQSQYEAYMKVYRDSAPEPLPKCIIHGPALDGDNNPIPGTGCPRLIEAIPKAKHPPLDKPGQNPEDVDRTHFRGMDSLDSWRYLEVGINTSLPEEPFENFRERMMTINLQNPLGSPGGPGSLSPDALPPTSLVMMNRVIEQRWKEKEAYGNSFTIPRKALGRRRQAWLEGIQNSSEDSI